MKSIIFYSGRFRLDELGAARVIASNLFLNKNKGDGGVIIGMRYLVDPARSRDELEQIDIIDSYLKKTIIYRAMIKVCDLVCANESLLFNIKQWIDVRLGIVADNLAARQAGNVFSNDSDIKYAIGLSSISLAFGKVAKAHGVKYVIHCQWCHPNTQNKLVIDGYKLMGLTSPHTSKLRYSRQVKEFELADVIWCPSDFVRRSLIENGVPPEKIFVSYLGVDWERFKRIEIKKEESKIFRILFVGRFCVQKGGYQLILALLNSGLKRSELIINGQIDDVGKTIVDKYRPILEGKEIFIRIDPGDPRRYHKTSSVFVLPSLHDAYGIVVPESMAAGMPIIISDHAGASEIVEHGGNGFVYPFDDVDKLSEYLNIYYDNRSLICEHGARSMELSTEYDFNKTYNNLMEKMYSQAGM